MGTESGIQNGTTEQIGLLVTVELREHEFDPGPFLAESQHRVGKQTETGRTGETDTDPPRLAAMRAPGHMYRLRGISEDAAGLLEECAATRGERHPPPVACKERHIELALGGGFRG